MHSPFPRNPNGPAGRGRPSALAVLLLATAGAAPLAAAPQ